MATVIIPVLLSLLFGPGVGQLYNKEYKKGILLILASAAVLALAMIWYYHAILPYLPKDLTAIDPQALTELLRNAMDQVTAKAGAMLSFFKALLTVLWLYGIVDAYLVANKNGRS